MDGLLGAFGILPKARLSAALKGYERLSFLKSLRAADERCTQEELRKSPSRIIFPAGLSQPMEQSDEAFQRYSPEQLTKMLLSDDNSVMQLEGIWVEFAIFYKERFNPKHELLLFKVRDSNNPRISNFILLDRTIDKPSTQIARRRVVSSFPRQQTVVNLFCGRARDRFYISNNGSFTAIANAWGKSHTLLESMRFLNPTSFKLVHLLTLASLTSSRCLAYHIRDGNCYWYAGTIWECMMVLSAQGFKHRLYQSGRGQFFSTKWNGPDHRADIVSLFPPALEKLRRQCIENKLVGKIKDFVKYTYSRDVFIFVRKYTAHNTKWQPRKEKDCLEETSPYAQLMEPVHRSNRS